MKPANNAPTYCAVYPGLADIARAHGFALAIHGTMSRDFDITAIPWIDAPADPQVVVDAMLAKYAFHVVGGPPTVKAHGRLVYTLAFFQEWALDLSFIPVLAAAPSPAVCTCEDDRQCQGCAGGRAASDAYRKATPSPSTLRADDGLDFTPDEQHTVFDMANVGYSLMQAIKRERPGYCWNESPAEIVGDLINEIDELKPESSALRAAQEAVGLPELPAPAMECYLDAARNMAARLPENGPGDVVYASDVLFTQEQMQEYGRACIAALRTLAPAALSPRTEVGTCVCGKIKDCPGLDHGDCGLNRAAALSPQGVIVELIAADVALDAAQDAYTDIEDHRRSMDPDEVRAISAKLDDAIERRRAALAAAMGAGA